MDRKQLRIFVIEDNLGDVLLIQEALNTRAIDAQLQVISSGDEAQKLLATLNPAAAPDLLIIDLNLPRVSGLEILESVRGNNNFSETAVLVLTSSKSSQDRVLAESLGADAFISKPLTLDEFLQAVGSTVERLFDSPGPRGCRSITREEPPASPLRLERPAERRRSSLRSAGSARAASQDGS